MKEVVDKKMTNNTLNALSLFSGMGGDTLGIEQANCKVIAYSEINKIFQISHEANFKIQTYR